VKHQSYARYPASSDVVIKMFSDKNFHTRKLEQMGMKFEVLEHAFDGKEFRIKVERRVPLQAPGMIKKVVPAETRVVNEERWTVASKTGRVKVEPQGIPINMSCTASMKDEGGECVITYNWDINATLPLMGALEKFIASDMEKKAQEENDVAVTLLGDYR
jgi:hypothetical protein